MVTNDIDVSDLISNHGIITLLESVCPNCKDHQKTEKCLHCDVTLCASCCQEHLTTWTADAKQTLAELQTTVDGVTMTPEVTKSRIQLVKDECHELREELSRNTDEKISELLQQQLQLNDQRHKQLCDIDKTQQIKINEILTQSTANREAVKNWKDRLNSISGLVGDEELTSEIILNVVRDIEEINGHLMSTDIKTDVITTSAPKDVLLPRGEMASNIARTNEDTDTSTNIPRTRTLLAGVVPYIPCTLDYYRNLSQSTYILSGLSPDGMKGMYVHMAISPVDSTIYIVDYGDNETGNIIHISDSGKHISCFGTCTQPRGISIDANGNIIVTSGTHTIQYFKSSGKLYYEQGSTGNSTGCFDWPYGATFGPKNELYVADGENMRVQVKKPGGEWAVHSVYNQKPIGLAVCPDGTLLVCTRNKKPELWKIDEDGTKTKINIADDGITRDTNFGFSQIAIDKDGYILLVDSGSHSIMVVDMKGKIHCRIGQKGSLPGQFNRPTGIALARDGRIVVSEHGNRRIQIF